MKLLKNKELIIIILVAVCALCATVLIVSIPKYNDINNKIESENAAEKAPVSSALTFDNDTDKYSNQTIDPISYLAGFMYEYVYEDIHFLTSVESWSNDEKLKEVADELLANTHGDEMKYVEAVILEQGSYFYYSSANTSYASYEIPISYYNVLPEDSVLYQMYKKSTLSVYGVDDFTFIEDIANPLSKAYGYHFAQHHLGLDTSNDDKETEYYKLRAQDNDNIRLRIDDQDGYDDYKDNYIWYLMEIASNDYVYLMGSPNANRIIDINNYFSDRKEYYDENDIEYEARWNYWSRNLTPHENIILDLPDKVDGLAEYFYSFTDDIQPEASQIEFDIESVNLRMSTDRNKWFLIDWDETLTEEGAVYSLIIYDKFDRMFSVRKDTRSLQTGKPGAQLFMDKRSWSWNSDVDDRILARMSIAFPDGAVFLTDPIELILND